MCSNDIIINILMILILMILMCININEILMYYY